MSGAWLASHGGWLIVWALSLVAAWLHGQLNAVERNNRNWERHIEWLKGLVVEVVEVDPADEKPEVR